FFSSRRRHTRFSRDWSSDVCSSDLSRTLHWNPPLIPESWWAADTVLFVKLTIGLMQNRDVDDQDFGDNKNCQQQNGFHHIPGPEAQGVGCMTWLLPSCQGQASYECQPAFGVGHD